MKFLDQFKTYVYNSNGKEKNIAIISNEESLSYKNLDLYSDRLGFYLENTLKNDKTPIVVYGHKSIYMLVCFMACVKSGRAYVPIDTSLPKSRINEIIEAVEPPLILAVEELEVVGKNVYDIKRIIKIIEETNEVVGSDSYVKADDLFYIIFTSGSTGKPKGVQITYDCLNHFIEWGLTLGTSAEDKQGKLFLNQAPFSFDLSVMDTYLSLASGGTLWTLDKTTQSEYQKLFKSLETSNINVWVSTPSFVDVCLADPNFSDKLLKNLEVFLFCGEILTNITAGKLQKRFPRSKIVNTYGPTESTVAVTEVLINKDIVNQDHPLPVGKIKQGSYLKIVTADGKEAQEGEKGEIIIIGNTVSTGYFKNSMMTQKVFYEEYMDGKTYRAYRTGDEGYLKEGMLYYSGRIDLQIKLHGYRIEIEDIENNILKIESVKNAVVVTKVANGKVSSLTAFVVCDKRIEEERVAAKRLKDELRRFVPEYMIPKKIVFLDKMPMNVNGKIDRKFLGGLI